MGLLICKNSLFCVPPIFKRYESAVLLPIFKWIAIFYYPFVNIRIANFAAINSRTFISKFSFFSNIPLQKASQHDFFAFVCINKFGSFCLSDLQLFNPKFSTHQRSFCLDRLFNTIPAWYEQAWFSDYIYCCCKYLSYIRAGRTAWIVENIKPINFVNSKTVIWWWERRFWPFSSFSQLVPWCGHLFFKPKNSISCDGFRIDFFWFMTKPRCWSKN